MVLKTVTYLGANIMQLDMDNSNFTSSDSDGLVFLPTSLSDDVIAESYTTYFPNDNVNVLWNKVELEWTRNTIDTNAPFKTYFQLYGIDEVGKTSFIGEQVKTSMTQNPVTEKVTFDLLKSACEPGMSLTANSATASHFNVNLPMTFQRYDDIYLEPYLPNPTTRKIKTFTLTGSSDGTNYNWACGPINVTYDADMASDFSDVSFWYWDLDVLRWVKLNHWLYTYVASTSAVFFFEMPILAQSTAYAIDMAYGNAVSGNAYRINNPYTKKDNTYQGQYHLHSDNSDGSHTPAVMGTAYMLLGYDWYSISDHQYLNSDPLIDDIFYIPSIEMTNNAIDNPNEITHCCAVGMKTHIPLNPASAADLVTEGSAADITYNGTTDSAKDMRQYYINGGTFGVATGDARLAGLGTQDNVNWALADGAWVVWNHPALAVSPARYAAVATGYHAMCVQAAQVYNYDWLIDGVLSQYNRFNLGIEDDTHTLWVTGDFASVLTANVRTGTDTSSNTTGFTVWDHAGASTISSSTDGFRNGSRSLKCVTSGTDAQEGFYVTATTVAGTFYYAHVWVFADAGQQMEFRSWDAVSGTTASTIFTGTGDWQRVTLQFAPGNTSPLLLLATYGGPVATTFYADEFYCYSSTLEGATAIHVNADELTRDNIVAGLIAGNYYLTYMDHELEMDVTDDGKSITVTTNKTMTIQWRTHNGTIAQTDTGVTTATYTPTNADIYVRIKATNATSGAIIWSNPLWIEVD